MKKIIRIPIIRPIKSDDAYGYVYMTTDLVRGYKYIGKHKSTTFDTKYFGSNSIIAKILKKRPSTLKCIPLEWVSTLEELNNREKYWISYFDAVNSPNFYNVLAGGDGGALTGEALERMKKSRKGQNAGVNHWAYGRHLSVEEKQRLSIVNTGASNPVSKPVYAFDLQGNLINTYVNRATVGIAASKISAICCFNARHTDRTRYYKGTVYADIPNYILAPILEEVVSVGEDGKRHHTQAHKNKISAKSKLFRHTPESKEKLRQAHLGTSLSEETRAKISKNRKGKRVGKDNPNSGGKAMTLEHHKAHSEFMKGKHMSPNTEFTSESAAGAKNSQARPVVQLTESGELVQEFSYLKEVKSLYPAQFPSEEGVRNCCKGKQFKYKGYRWMYKEDYEKLNSL